MNFLKPFSSFKTMALLAGLISLWAAVFQLNGRYKLLNETHSERKKIRHQQDQHQEQLKHYTQQFEYLKQHNKLTILDGAESAEFFKQFCGSLGVQLQDIRVKPEDERSVTEYPVFHRSGSLSAVITVETLDIFYDFIRLLSKDFPGVVVYKTIKISKMAQATSWVGFVDFSYFTVDISDYMATFVAKPAAAAQVNQGQPRPKAPSFLLKAILYSSPQEWAIWLNDQKITDFYVNDDLTIHQVTPTAVIFIHAHHGQFKAEPGDCFTLTDS